ncbi:phospholipase A [Iodobacter sp. HSC-16F04]|uniref:Phospholipase A1 n=1 Tax=Iodobacter violaceini TaxID=3044271 RepID=A0ABX0KQN0_9NEIS|nr:phospholipase A [Iodobacter violacea]NHQ86192.1 phospholipase A [Iodobacter violacea]
MQYSKILLLGAVVAAHATADVGLLQQCKFIADAKARLACYDNLDQTGVSAKPPGERAETIEKLNTEPRLLPLADINQSASSALGDQWELDQKKGTFALRTYRTNYFLPISYSDNRNQHPSSSASTGQQIPLAPGVDAVNDAEAKFQLSFKVKALENIFSDRADFWLAYTQKSYWQVYNSDYSAPFRETNYEPEGILSVRTDLDLGIMKWRFLNLGLAHQSNGRSNPLSRSWNRAYADFGFEKDNFSLEVRPWYRFKEKEETDDNPDLLDFMGYGDITARYRFASGQELSALMRQNFRSGKGAVQLDWTYPLTGNLKAYLQVFSGYGDNLLDYNRRQNVLGVGIAISP